MRVDGIAVDAGNLTPNPFPRKGNRNFGARAGKGGTGGPSREGGPGAGARAGSQGLLLDDDSLDGGDFGVVAEGAAEVFGFLPCFVFVVGLD